MQYISLLREERLTPSTPCHSSPYRSRGYLEALVELGDFEHILFPQWVDVFAQLQWCVKQGACCVSRHHLLDVVFTERLMFSVCTDKNVNAKEYNI